MQYSYTHIRVEKPDPRIAVLSFNRPEKLNSWTLDVLDDMCDFFLKLKNDSETSVLVMRGDGTKAYCAGVDFKNVFPNNLRANKAYTYTVVEKLCSIVKGIVNCPQVVINLAFGYSIGGGFIVAMASDIRIISDNVKFQLPLLKLGVGCGDLGSSYFLSREIGSGVAKDILLTGRYMLAEEAVRLGFVSQCVPFEKLDEVGMAKANDLAKMEPMSLRLSKELLNIAQDANSLEDMLILENRTNSFISVYNQDKNYI